MHANAPPLDVVERVAKALCNRRRHYPTDVAWKEYVNDAKAAIAAMGEVQNTPDVVRPASPANPETFNESLDKLIKDSQHPFNFITLDQMRVIYDEWAALKAKSSEIRYAHEGLLEAIRVAANKAGGSLTHRMAEKAALAAFDYLRGPKREIVALSDDDKKEIVNLMASRAEAMGEISIRRSIGSALSAFLSDPRYEIRRRV
jgi:hypothetical protein